MKFEDLKKLHQKKYRESSGFFLLEGEHLVMELQKAALNNPLLKSCELYVTYEHSPWSSSFATHVINSRHMMQITETRNPQGIVALVPMLPPTSSKLGERAICLHEIQDPGNLGTILRTLAWFGNFRCLLTPNSVDPHNSKAIRASMGAIFHVPIETEVPLESLRERFTRIAWLHTTGQSLQCENFKNFNCYLFGNEARGVPSDKLNELCAVPFTIPGTESVESLNLASAVNMCAYEIARMT